MFTQAGYMNTIINPVVMCLEHKIRKGSGQFSILRRLKKGTDQQLSASNVISNLLF